MSKHAPPVRVSLSAVSGVAALSLVACGSGASTDGAGSSAAPSSPTVAPTTATATVTVTTTVTPSATPPGTQPAVTSSSASAAATSLAGKACRTWKKADGQSAAAGSGTYDRAARTARDAAQAASRYKRLSSDMAFVSELPLTGNSEPDVDKAQRATGRIAATCRTLGVPGIRHG